MTAANTTALATPQTAPARPNWEHIGDFLVLLAYSGTVLFTVRYHEKWADEAQAWLIARDLPLSRIWFHEAKYEGTPGLWHTILWVAQHWFHMPYAALGYLGAAFAIAGVAFLILKSPFPWYVRWLLVFTYFFVYQYAVIARPYTLLPLFCFIVAFFFKDVRHPGRMTVLLVLLANLSVHGTVLAAVFGLLYLMEAFPAWRTFDDRLRNRYFICAAVLVVTFVFIAIILRPTPDNEEYLMKHRMEQLPPEVKAQLHIATPLKKLTTAVSGAFLDFLAPSFAFVFLVAAWCFTRRRLLTFLLPILAMIALYSVVHGYAHHHGTVLVAAITALWIAWPTHKEESLLSARYRWALRGVIACMWVLCFVNIWDAAVVIKREYRYPYSGAKDAADYLKSVGADRGPMFGLLYGVAALQPYFDHNIFANLPTTYFHHGLPLAGTWLDTDALQQIQPEYIVVYSVEPDLMARTGSPELTTRGYERVHFSDGYYMYKQGVYQRDSYFIFRRVRPPADGN